MIIEVFEQLQHLLGGGLIDIHGGLRDPRRHAPVALRERLDDLVLGGVRS